MRTQQKQSGIYAITHTQTGRQYIGSTQSLDKRWKEHVYLLERGKHHNPKLQAAWSKHGPSGFVYSVIENVSDGGQLLAREQHYLDSTKPHYNIALSSVAPMRGRKMPPGASEQVSKRFKGRVKTPEHQAKITAANTGRRHTEETKAKIAAIRRGTHPTTETRQKLSAIGKGRVLTPEHKAKISASLKGHAVTAETRAKLLAAIRAKYPNTAKPRTPNTAKPRMTQQESIQQLVMRAKNKSPEHLEKMRQGVIRAWKRRKEQSNVGRDCGPVLPRQ